MIPFASIVKCGRAEDAVRWVCEATEMSKKEARYTTIALAAIAGVPHQEIAAKFDCSTKTVGRAVQWYRHEGKKRAGSKQARARYRYLKDLS